MASLDQSIETLLGTEDLVIADVGAAYGLPSYLKRIEKWATLCLFEPDAEQAAELRMIHRAIDRKKKAYVFEIALSASGGERVLYQTNIPTGSSLLKPGSEAFRDFGDPAYFFPVVEHRVLTRRLDEVLDEAGIQTLDFIKLDVQGAETEVLRGLGDRLEHSTLGVELEVGLPGGYLEQPSIGEVDEFLRARGFALFDLRPVRLHRWKNGDRDYYPRQIFKVHESSSTLSKRIWEVDAVYFRKAEEVIKDRSESELRKLLVLYCAYGFFAEAYYLLSHASTNDWMPASTRSKLRDAIVEWHRCAHYCLTESPACWRMRQFFRNKLNRLLRVVCGRRYPTWLFNES